MKVGCMILMRVLANESVWTEYFYSIKAGAHDMPNVNCTVYGVYRHFCCIVRVDNFLSKLRVHMHLVFVNFFLLLLAILLRNSQCVNTWKLYETVC